MHAKSSSPVTPASLVSVDDPLRQILGCLSEPDALAQLYAARCKSPDIRASLRLLAPEFMDALWTASAAARSVALGSPESVGGCAGGTALARTLAEHALQGSDAAATILTDLLDNDHAADCVTQWVSQQEIAANILSRVKARNMGLDSFALLLQALNERSNTAGCDEGRWIRDLLAATAEAVAAIPNGSDDQEHNSTQLLCLFSLLLTQHKDEAVRLLNTLDFTRKMARHVINMLSRPSPLIAAPALHVLSRILLHPHDSSADPDLRQRSTTLSILAVSPGRKLFDDSHMSRTLVLAADMCLNCVAADMKSKDTVDADTRAALIASDLRVLDAVAGVIQASASAQSQEIRNQFFQTTAMVPAIQHLVYMAELDRRYLNPLLCIVNSILSLSDGNTALPLVVALVQPGQRSQHESVAESTQTRTSEELSIIDKIVELLISSIEDVADTVPRFTLPPIDLGSANPEDVTSSDSHPNFSWPRVSSEEGGCGWFINCTRQQRESVLLFLQLALQAEHDQYWVHELFATVTQIVHGFIHIGESPGLEAVAGDPFGLSQNEVLSNSCSLNSQAQAERQILAMGSYYWAIKPILSFVADLIASSSSVATYWREELCGKGMADILQWSESVCQHAANDSGTMLGRALNEEIGDALTSFNRGVADDSQHISSSVQPSVVTPSESASSTSSSVSPRLDCDIIAIDELRAANSNKGLGISSSNQATLSSETDAAALVQAAVIRHWARTCEIELAAAILGCHYAAADNADGTKQLLVLNELVRQARVTLVPQSAHHQTSLFLDSIRLAVTVQRRFRQQNMAQQTTLLHRAKQLENNLVSMEESNARMQEELLQQKTHISQQQAQCAQQQGAIQTLESAKCELEGSIATLEEQKRQMEADSAEWKEECIRTRDHLEQSEASHQAVCKQLAQVSDERQQSEDAFNAKQVSWETTQQTMTENVRKLEIALGEAVARLRELESQNAAERAVADGLRSQQAVMGAKLAEYSKLSETLFNLSRFQH